MELRFDFEKSLQAAAYLLDLEEGRMPFLRLLKLMYIAERELLAQTATPLTGDIYKATEHGPVLSHVFDLIIGKGSRSAEWEGFIKRNGYAVKLVVGPGRGRLSGDVIDKLAEVSERYRERGHWELRDLMHEFPEWAKNFPAARPGGNTMIHTCIGCDVAPKKGGDLFDGSEFRQLTPQELADDFARLASRPDMLVAWDSPLTGPVDPDARLVVGGQDLTQRQIETFFRTDAWGFKVPKGISVLPYCGCSHWTISHRVLGLPKVGPYSLPYEELPFRLVFDRDELTLANEPRASVVEVHPAVAVWLWCRKSNMQAETWKYKKNPARVRELWRLICEQVDETEGLPLPESDDQLDAIVAWLLAERWIAGNGVVLLGNRRTGSFLVPESDTLLAAFDRFLRATGNQDATRRA